MTTTDIAEIYARYSSGHPRLLKGMAGPYDLICSNGTPDAAYNGRHGAFLGTSREDGTVEMRLVRNSLFRFNDRVFLATDRGWHEITVSVNQFEKLIEILGGLNSREDELRLYRFALRNWHWYSRTD